MLKILNSKPIQFLVGLSIILIVIITSIELHSFNRNFYKESYQKLKTAETIGISSDDLNNSTEVLLDYLQNNRDDLKIKVNQNNQEKEMFNQLEVDHMVDVRDLYQTALLVRNISIVFFTLIVGYYFYKSEHNLKAYIFNSYNKALIVTAFVLLMIVSYALIDFSGFWTVFHKIFFRNDLWILNPQTDNLILMVPEPFFNQLVVNILLTIIISLSLVYLFLKYINRKKKTPHLNIVLFEPEIPQNVGNIIRTVMASESTLHIIEPTGFIWDDKKLKRSGMDYIKDADIKFHDDLKSFQQQVNGKCYYITRYGKQAHTEVNYNSNSENIYLIFGKESTGLPLDLLHNHQQDCLRIPMSKHARSLNLSNCVALCTYEVLRQFDYQELSKVEVQKGMDWLNTYDK